MKRLVNLVNAAKPRRSKSRSADPRCASLSDRSLVAHRLQAPRRVTLFLPLPAPLPLLFQPISIPLPFLQLPPIPFLVHRPPCRIRGFAPIRLLNAEQKAKPAPPCASSSFFHRPPFSPALHLCFPPSAISLPLTSVAAGPFSAFFLGHGPNARLFQTMLPDVPPSCLLLPSFWPPRPSRFHLFVQSFFTAIE